MAEAVEVLCEMNETPDRATPLLTVCIPTRNRREVLEECLASGFLLTEMMRCVIERRPFYTNAVDIVRDYVAPSDLFSLVKLCVASNGINQPVDVFSAGPVRKSELIALFSRDFGLETRIDEEGHVSSTGAKLAYYSANHVARSLLNYVPALASRDAVRDEANEIIAGGRNWKTIILNSLKVKTFL